MKYFLLLVSIFTVLSCSTSSKKLGDLTQEEQRVRAVIMSLDNKISGTHGRESKGDFSSFNGNTYTTYLAKLESPRANEMKDLFNQFEVKQFSNSTHGFQFCGYSSKLKIAFCDDTLCQEVEYFEKADSPKVIEAWKKELPLQKCPNIANSGSPFK